MVRIKTLSRYEQNEREHKIAKAALRRKAVQKPGELLSLLRFLRKHKLRTVVEIGTAAGGTFYALAQIAEPDALLVSIDLPGHDGYTYGAEASQDLLRLYARPGQEVRFLRRDSQELGTLADLKRLLANREIDLLFIDGDHSFRGALTDFERYSPLAKLVVFHDIVVHPTNLNCHVDLVWKRVKRERVSHEFIEEGAPWGGIGVLEMENRAVCSP